MVQLIAMTWMVAKIYTSNVVKNQRLCTESCIIIPIVRCRSQHLAILVPMTGTGTTALAHKYS